MNAARPAGTRVGDWVELRSQRGVPRLGQIIEVIGADGRRRYRVRWDEKHESIVYPSASSRILAAEAVVPPAHVGG